MEASMGVWVVDYVQHKCNPNSPTRWKRIGDMKNANSVKVAEILKSRIVHMAGGNDTLIWNAAKSGSYKVSLGYKLQRQRQEDRNWPSALCWDKWVLPKAGAFIWIALHGRILTSDRLKLVGIAGPNSYCLWKNEEETTYHILFNCSYSRNYWDWLKM
ncbi:uncharacterized protein LOC131045977 [Cryptomeria japonica]|uniref:uncharacterized protein LOC131045977 n=1 Tax=Cryptomeria japonica TaxID=3369 RepID=UPI0027DA7EA3|nr:uncharacterized protein LOC131045977 [Cryptomeria japonica]